jgi:hypothetical protein
MWSNTGIKIPFFGLDVFEKCQDLSITHKNYNNLHIIFNTANPKLAHFNIREINEVSLESDTQTHSKKRPATVWNIFFEI